MVLQYIRTKELHQQYQDVEKIYKDIDANSAVEFIRDLQNTFIKTSPHSFEIKPHVLSDSQLESWVNQLPSMKGTREFLWNQLRNPVHHTDILKLRQRCVLDYVPNHARHWAFMIQHEKDVLWAMHLPPLEKSWPIPLLFPQWFAIRWINHSSNILNLYHLYRIYGNPLSQFIYPITLIVGPWWYARTKMKWNISWSAYQRILKGIFLEMIKIRSENVKEVAIKVLTLSIYLGVYLYGVLQSFDVAYMLYSVRKQLAEKVKSIHRFVKTAKEIWNQNPSVCENIMRLWGLPAKLVHVDLRDSIQGMYTLYKVPSVQQKLKVLLCQMYAIQTIHVMSAYHKANKSHTSFVTWTSGPTKMYGMGHPCLPKTQQRNPFMLDKNLIMTGPNAAGKTTYVRSILANYILAQSFGLCFAKRASMVPVKMITSFMRVQDSIGSMSLYEAECQRCKELIEETADADRPILVFLDEPMHATPPIEGASTAMAFAKYLGQKDNVKLIITTHYHVLTNLEKIASQYFRNISMDVNVIDPFHIEFSYKLRPGPSYQSIAIEMLEKDAFPKEMLKDAIEIKNKICSVENK